MPRTRSSSKRSGLVPVKAATSADLPWSTCPAVPMTCNYVLTRGSKRDPIVRQDLSGGANPRLRAALHETLVLDRGVLAREMHAPLTACFVPGDRRALTDQPARVARQNVRIGLRVAERRAAVPRRRDAGPDLIELLEEIAYVALDGRGIADSRVRHRRRVDHARRARGEDLDQAVAAALTERIIERALHA